MEVLDNVVKISLAPSTAYAIKMTDQNDLSVVEAVGASNSQGELVINLPTKYTQYDGWFALEVSLLNDSVVYLDTVLSVRPLVPINTIVEYMEGKLTEEQAAEYESYVRHLINSIVGFEFNFVHKNLHTVGNGTDFVVTDDRILKVYSVKENNIVIWSNTDASQFPYEPWVNLRGIVRKETDTDNRLEGVIGWSTRYGSPIFRYGWDYVFEVDAGWPVIPQDIQNATLLLINDIACGNNRYYNKYISSVKGAINISYFQQVIAGTGNLYVDNILSKYVLESVRAKVL